MGVSVKTITFGTILEPKFDKEFNSGHLVVRDVFQQDMSTCYELLNIKTKDVSCLAYAEVIKYYDVCGQEDIGKVLFCVEEEK